MYSQDLRKEIGKNIIAFIELKGYAKKSISRLAGISASTLNCIIEGEMSHDLYHINMVKITESLNLPLNFFLEPPKGNKEKWQISTTKHFITSSTNERSELAQSLLNDLDELLTVAAFYIK